MDRSSRRLAAPTSWLRPSLRDELTVGAGHHHWGANAVEIEAMRYRPRRELTAALRRYDLIQVVCGGAAWAAPVLRCGPPVVVQVATTAAWERESQLPASKTLLRAWRRGMTGLTARLEATALRQATAVLVENDVMLDHVRSLGQANVFKLAPGVDTDTFRPSDDGWRSDGYLLSVCRLGDPRKGLDRMVTAYHRLVISGHPVPDLVLAGRGNLPASVSGLISQFGLANRVTVLSDVPAGELPSLYQGASVFLQTSYEEGLGLSSLEAMACGLPVVATRTHGASEVVVDGVTGWLVRQDEVHIAAAIADGVLRILRGDGGAFAPQARQRCVRKFSRDVCLQRFTGLYDALLTRSAVATR
ncbi:MAG TPA: glycosyltransferase family 4 protein [Actinoplanes sp.]|nr:glycosyltransferase family 4 protein [Actinoplanes sp.]